MTEPRSVSGRSRRIGPLSAAVEAFLAANYVCTLTTMRRDGTAHVTPVRFSWDGAAGIVRVMTMATHRKAINIRADPAARATICQVDGFRWISLSGAAVVSHDPARIAEGARRYAERYGVPPPSTPLVVVLEIAVDEVMGLG